MSSHPGEIVTEDEDEDEVVEEISDDDDDDEDLMPEDEDEDMMMPDDGNDFETLITSLLATEEGETVCTALVNIAQQLQTQNKILIKILSQMKN